MAPGDRLVFHTLHNVAPVPSHPRKRGRRQTKMRTPTPSPPLAHEGSPLFEPEAPQYPIEMSGVKREPDSENDSLSNYDRRDDQAVNLPVLQPDHVSQLTAVNTLIDIGPNRSQANSFIYKATHAFDTVGPDSSVSQALSHKRVGSEEFVNPRNAQAQSPAKRYTYRDIKGILRDIWQPGDPNGLRDGEFPDATTYVERLRFFQHDIGLIHRERNPPPKYVILDDKSCYDIWHSDQYNARERARFWHHDFSSNGNIRHGRINRGRPALVSAADGGEVVDRRDTCGPREVGWGMSGNKKKGKRYYFTGERNGYQEVQFVVRDIPVHPEPAPQTEDGSTVPAEEQLPPEAARGKRKATSTGTDEQQTQSTGSTLDKVRKRRRLATSPDTLTLLSNHIIVTGSRNEPYENSAIYPDPRSHKRHMSDISKPDDEAIPSEARTRASGTKPTRYATAPFHDDDDDDDDDSSSSSPVPPKQINQGYGTIYAGMSYSHQDDEDLPARLNLQSISNLRTPDAYTDSFHNDNANIRGERRVDGKGGDVLERGKDGPLWKRVSDLEAALGVAKLNLRSRDDEIQGLRRELQRLRETCVQRMVREGREEGLAEKVVVDLVSEGEGERQGEGDVVPKAGNVELGGDDDIACGARKAEGRIGLESDGSARPSAGVGAYVDRQKDNIDAIEDLRAIEEGTFELDSSVDDETNNVNAKEGIEKEGEEGEEQEGEKEKAIKFTTAATESHCIEWDRNENEGEDEDDDAVQQQLLREMG